MPFTPLTDVQYLVVSILGPRRMSGPELRKELNKRGVSKTSAAAYEVLGRMARAGLLETEWQEWEEDGEKFRRKTFWVTGAGARALDETRTFYNAPLTWDGIAEQ